MNKRPLDEMNTTELKPIDNDVVIVEEETSMKIDDEPKENDNIQDQMVCFLFLFVFKKHYLSNDHVADKVETFIDSFNFAKE